MMHFEGGLYMSDCIFCKIVDGSIPSNKVLENDKFVAFHDLNPVKKVHVLIIPKNHVDNIATLNADNESKSTPASNENLQNFVNKDVEIV